LLHLRKGRFSSTWLSTNQNCAASNLAFSDHLQDNTSCTTGISLRKGHLVLEGTYLSNHALGDLAGVETVIKTKTSDVGVSSDTLNTC
jgi:hypothetical protein